MLMTCIQPPAGLSHATVLLTGICSRPHGSFPFSSSQLCHGYSWLHHPCNYPGLKPLRGLSPCWNPPMPLPPSSLSLSLLQGPSSVQAHPSLDMVVGLSDGEFPSPTHLCSRGQQVWEEAHVATRSLGEAWKRFSFTVLKRNQLC